jgi:hypothetical protein
MFLFFVFLKTNLISCGEYRTSMEKKGLSSEKDQKLMMVTLNKVSLFFYPTIKYIFGIVDPELLSRIWIFPSQIPDLGSLIQQQQKK